MFSNPQCKFHFAHNSHPSPNSQKHSAFLLIIMHIAYTREVWYFSYPLQMCSWLKCCIMSEIMCFRIIVYYLLFFFFLEIENGKKRNLDIIFWLSIHTTWINTPKLWHINGWVTVLLETHSLLWPIAQIVQRSRMNAIVDEGH